jgi:signal transduction histidine kinase
MTTKSALGKCESSKISGATLPVHGFVGEFRQVLSNLIVNALDAMDAEGGVLTLRIRPPVARLSVQRIG